MNTDSSLSVGLFIPCYMDMFYPEVAKATLELLIKQGCKVEYPIDQTCCGQPMANAGCESEAIATYRHFIKTFKDYDYVVCPSGSCTYHVKTHYDIIGQDAEVAHLRKNTYELSEFLLDILKIRQLSVSFPYRVGLHHSCHGQRGLRLASSSERVGESYSKQQELLGMVEDIELIKLDKSDECCGFGGTFSIGEAEVSTKMGEDRIQDHLVNGAQYITAGDMSCLMHLEGLINRQKHPIKLIHLAQILNGYTS